MERWQRVMERQGNAPPDDIPIVLAREGHHGPVIHAANRAARLNGIHPGSRVVDMRAICPELQVEYADPVGDQAALDRLVLWARRWCPWTVRDGEDGLILDTTGSDHLLGGEAAMLVEMETQLSLLGLSAQLAVAPTWGAAWALARFGPVRSICGPDEVGVKLGALPVTGLRLDGETVLLLRRLGLKTIGAVMDVPRLSLTRRFVKAGLEANPLMRLDQALGKLAEPVASVDAQPRFRVQSRLAEPIFDPTPYLPELCENLCEVLKQAGQGCRRLHLTVYRTDGDVSHVDVATSATTRDPGHLHGLFRDKVERINPGFGFDLITLEAGGVEEMQERQNRLDGGSDDDLHLTRLVDRLSAKFGAHAVTRPVLRESHIPERAEGQVAALATMVETGEAVAKERPLRLFDHPEEVRVLYAVPEGPPAQFVWRRQTHRVARYAGPERIAPEWWKDRPGTRLRDYFKVEDQAGRRIWLYREGLHEDGRGGDPRWFVHGCFA
ncbi:DNA polymerase Y family protein [Cognatiyoonia sp. IB215446]|uniref:Y-family DNA polymerase n=1 Tax=Cognatiyoonia sp. IB215446 TaxID=3097355 RepID=UPI002A114978|nr:DNA polymerase Y family protein [Cognatiyoonia sp. IB215446]MDX8347511.1 DNA polymerase Y family protein [Cognatiyoonia sp. IB215446]